jgi:hypothetical protein
MSDAITDPTVVTVQPPVASDGSENSSSESGASVSDKASQVAGSAKQSGTEVAQNAADKAKTVAAETQRQARNLVGEAQDQVREQAQTQQQRASSGLHSLADQLRGMADQGDQSSVATDLARQASDRAHGVASWLEQRQPGDLIDELRRFARQRPGTFLLAAAAAGVLAGRLTRGVVAAQSDQKSEQESATSGTPSTEGFVAEVPPPVTSSAEYGYPTEAGTSYGAGYPAEAGTSYGAGYSPAGYSPTETVGEPSGAPYGGYPQAPQELAEEHIPVPTQPSSVGTTSYGAPNPYAANPDNPYGSNPETQGQP